MGVSGGGAGEHHYGGRSLLGVAPPPEASSPTFDAQRAHLERALVATTAVLLVASVSYIALTTIFGCLCAGSGAGRSSQRPDVAAEGTKRALEGIPVLVVQIISALLRFFCSRIPDANLLPAQDAICGAAARQPEEARRHINSWVAAATNNLIQSILPQGSVKSDTGLVVATAIYFKATWQAPFRKHATMESKFHRLDGAAVDAEFMRSSTGQFIATYEGFKVVKMPYAVAVFDRTNRTPRQQNDTAIPRDAPPLPDPLPQYSMLVVLPDARDGISTLEDKMVSSPSFLEEHMPEKVVEVGDFRVPKFKLCFHASAKGALQGLGIMAVFDPVAADVPDVVEDNGSPWPLFLEDVFHKAVIEVNDEGTEAAACCTVTVRVRGSSRRLEPPKRVDFVADHPFTFFMVEEMSGVILFAGHVLDPTMS
ncbi:hypothetical protein U9M48_015010 [Paspalum notatum var. saurae]|uniref:Serpin domain-containing protein n=1 Tax=Paspalum notatum var. saurae TaxID=547442 RepID=A0AAQ3T3T8_PASNO